MALGGLLAGAAFAQSSDGLSQATLESAYNRLAPAIGLVEYSSEITNEMTGETAKRDTNALGLVVSPKGLVMVHGHMVLENTQPFNVRVTLGQGDAEKEYDATVLKKPDDINVVFLQLKSDTPLNLPYVKFAPSDGVRLASPVGLFGVLSEALDYQPALTASRVGAVLDKPRRTLCLDANLRFGFVGGPVIDATGAAVGVVGFDLSREEGGDLYVRSGQPLIYQEELFQKYIDNPPTEKEVKEDENAAWLGVFTQPLTDEMAEYWKLPKQGGLVVSTIVPNSPAASAGIQPGDVIVDFAGTPIQAKLDREVLGFTKLVRDAGAGSDVKVKLLRAGQPMTVDLKLGIRPRSSKDANEYEDPIFGLTVREITTDLRIALNLAADVQGVIVRRVKSGSVAQVGKMRPGVIIMSFGDHPVTSLDDFKAAVEKVAKEKPAEVSVFARVGPATGFFRLEPRWNP
jgi:serine protease Do